MAKHGATAARTAMIRRSLAPVLLAQALAAGGLGAGEPLDLRVEPGDVEAPDAPPALPDLSDAEPAWREPGGDPGWSVRPEVELDARGRDDGEATLRALDMELESLGVRLERTW